MTNEHQPVSSGTQPMVSHDRMVLVLSAWCALMALSHSAPRIREPRVGGQLGLSASDAGTCAEVACQSLGLMVRMLCGPVTTCEATSDEPTSQVVTCSRMLVVAVSASRSGEIVPEAISDSPAGGGSRR